MNFTAEQLKKINEAKSAEELIALAKAEGIEMSEEEIKAKFEAMHKEGEVADDELDNVAGGACDDGKLGNIVKIKSTGQTGQITYVITAYRYYRVTLDDGSTVDCEEKDIEVICTAAAISF